MEQAFTLSLQKFFTAKPTDSEKKGSNPRAEFYAKYKQEAEHADKDFQKKYEEDLNTTLIFVRSFTYLASIELTFGGTQAGLFSAVTSGFILNLEGSLQSDPNEETAALLRVLIYKMDNTTFGGQVPPLQVWNGPDPNIVACQAVLYASLGISLLAAFLAMLGKQWLTRFGKAKVRGSEIDESRNRQRKLSGMVSWKFDLVMESLPLMLQSALLLLGYALSRYLWSVNMTVASIVIGITSIGLAFYVFIVIAGTLADNCPFQTPTSHILRSIYRLDNSRNRYIARTRRAVLRLWLRTTRLYRATTLKLLLPLFTPFKNKRRSLIDQPQRKAVRLFSKKETDHDAYNVDAGCVVWMVDTARGQTASRIISNFIPEVVWHRDIKASPSLPYLYDQAMDCFDFEEEKKVSLVSRLRDQAFSATKAFIHVYSHMRVTGAIDDSFVVRTRVHHTQLADGQHKEDSDLESTLWLLDYIMDRQRQIDWSETKMTYQHRAWVAHVVLCLAWLKGGRLDESLHGFVAETLGWRNWNMATDCILLLYLSLGIPIHADDLLVMEKRWVSVYVDWACDLMFIVGSPSRLLLIICLTDLRYCQSETWVAHSSFSHPRIAPPSPPVPTTSSTVSSISPRTAPNMMR